MGCGGKGGQVEELKGGEKEGDEKGERRAGGEGGAGGMEENEHGWVGKVEKREK